MSKIDRNQSCISQLRRLFKVKRSNNIIENGPLWIGYSKLFLKLMCRCFLFFMASENEKNKRGKLFPLLHTVHFAHLWVHTHSAFIFNNKDFISLYVNLKLRTSFLNTSIVSSSVWQNSSAASFIANISTKHNTLSQYSFVFQNRRSVL